MLTRRRFLAQSAVFLANAACPIHSASFAEWVGDHESPPTSHPGTLLIDSHVHVFERNPRFPFAPGAHPPADDAPPEKLIALMHANGVARTVIIQVIHYKWDNSFLLSVLRRYPTLFHGVCRVNPEDPAAPDELARLTEEGFRGVRLSPAADATGDWIRGPLMPPLWRRCNELKVPMTLLVPATRLPDLVPLIEANPSSRSSSITWPTARSIAPICSNTYLTSRAIRASSLKSPTCGRSPNSLIPTPTHKSR